MVLLSLAIAYEAAVLLVYNMPGRGLGSGPFSRFHRWLGMREFIRATGQGQDWALFAPNPYRYNPFVRVLVKPPDGPARDLEHDIYGRRRYPYLFYDRMGRVNNHLSTEPTTRKYYAAHVCREWERTHGGEPAEEVRFINFWTNIPAPHELGAELGYDPLHLEVHQSPLEALPCASLVHGQLPNELRERYGLPPLAPGVFRQVDLDTWAHPRPAPGASPGAGE
jgi:hypothetical protein